MPKHGASINRSEENIGNFGKDEGLIHEAVVMGRKVGAGRLFWSRLAHDEDYFRKIVAREKLLFTPSHLKYSQLPGINFLASGVVEEALDVSFTETQLRNMEYIRTIPESFLKNQYQSGDYLVPVYPFSFNDLVRRFPGSFDKQQGKSSAPWSNEPLQCSWYWIRPDAISVGTWGSQKELAKDMNMRPMPVALAAYLAILLQRLHFRKDFQVMTRCSEVILGDDDDVDDEDEHIYFDNSIPHMGIRIGTCKDSSVVSKLELSTFVYASA